MAAIILAIVASAMVVPFAARARSNKAGAPRAPAVALVQGPAERAAAAGTGEICRVGHGDCEMETLTKPDVTPAEILA